MLEKLEFYLNRKNNLDTSFANLNEYIHLLLEGLENLDGNAKIIFIYSILESSKDLGFKEGQEKMKNKLISFLNK